LNQEYLFKIFTGNLNSGKKNAVFWDVALSTDVSEERIASIFRLEKFASGEPA
jgi:hypothetical protein